MLKSNIALIGGITINNVTMADAVDKVLEFTESEGKKLITTPNLDFLYNASKDEDFKNILLSSDLNIPDGKPLILISKAKGTPLKEKVSGADFFIEVCKAASQSSNTIYLLGAGPGVAEEAKNRLTSRFKGLKIVGTHSPSFGFEKNEEESMSIVKMINETNPDILFVGVGSPKQEKWINQYIPQLNIKVAAGVGASFDFAAGNVAIPPPFVKKIGFAWLWRLISEPKRLWKRYLVNNLPLFFKLYIIALVLKK